MFNAFTANKIGVEGGKELREIENDVQQHRLEKRKQYHQAISLILLSYRFSQESAFHVLPLEMVHMIIRFVLNDIPAATTFDIRFRRILGLMSESTRSLSVRARDRGKKTF